MRHRRRYSTQTIQKKKRSSVSYPAYPRKSRSSFKVFRNLAVIVLLGGAVYAGITYVYPQIMMLIPEAGTETVEQPADEPPKLPIEEEPLNNAPVTPVIREMIQVEVLNGCGEQGIAKFLADKLKESRYDVVNMGNYIENGKPKWDVEKTRLIDQIGKLEQTRKLGELIGVDYAQIETYENPSPIADITIIIGNDYKTLSIFQDRQ